jgi:hypothetical protein
MLCFHEEPRMEFDVTMTFGEQRTQLNFQKVKELLIQRLKLALSERLVAPNRKYFRIPTTAKRDPNPNITPAVEVKANLKNREQSTMLQQELEFIECQQKRKSLGINNNNNATVQKTNQQLAPSAITNQFVDRNEGESKSREREPHSVPQAQNMLLSATASSSILSSSTPVISQVTSSDEVNINSKRFPLPVPPSLGPQTQSEPQTTSSPTQPLSHHHFPLNAIGTQNNTPKSSENSPSSHPIVAGDDSNILVTDDSYSLNGATDNTILNTPKESTRDRIKSSLRRGKEKIMRKIFHSLSEERDPKKETK